jgi:3-oxoacyl-[acyl-carrier-protein] synthase-3
MYSKIESIEYFLPTKKKLNHFKFDKIYSKTGILNTRTKKSYEDVIDLAYKACLKHKNKIKNIDGIIFVTQTPKYLLPSCSCILQDRFSKNIGRKIYTIDINMGCSGFNYGLSVADSLIKNKICKKILLVCSDAYSDYISEKNSNKYIFSDAASATLVSPSNKERISNFKFYTDGSKHKSIIIKKNENKNFEFYMNGREVFAFTLNQVPKFIHDYIKKIKKKVFFKKYFFHQASGFILDNLARKFDEKLVYKNVKYIGNTTSSSIPISIKLALKSKKIKKGDNLLLCGFGVGLSISIVSLKI